MLIEVTLQAYRFLLLLWFYSHVTLDLNTPRNCSGTSVEAFILCPVYGHYFHGDAVLTAGLSMCQEESTHTGRQPKDD